MNSGRYDGMSPSEAKRAIVDDLAAEGLAEAQVNYRLHDWCISRQRYWGPPIPIIHCDDCGPVPVPDDDLPVVLPRVDDFRPDDTGISPLARVRDWYEVPCPSCGRDATRETDVSDTFLDSAWYFLRYPSTDFDDRPFDAEITRRWLPVDTYIGGNEHAVLHLLYARFVTMALHDMGILDFEEPFTQFRAHGLIIREGAKMSKSKGNVIVPDPIIERYGADTFRLYLMFLGPFMAGGDYQDRGISGPHGFLHRLWASVVPQDGELPDHAIDPDRGAEAAPDHQAGDRPDREPALQHGHRRHDGVPERGQDRWENALPGRGRAAGSSDRALRSAYGRGVVGAAGA